MDRRDAALVDCIRICPSLNQGMDYIDLILLIQSTRCRPAVTRIMNWLGTAAIRGRYLRAACEQLGDQARKIGSRRDMEGRVAGIRVMSDSFEVKRSRIGPGRPGYQGC